MPIDSEDNNLNWQNADSKGLDPKQGNLAKDPKNFVPVASILRKSRAKWRIFAFLALALAILALLGRFGIDDGIKGSDHIARIIIEDTIITDKERLEIIQKLGKDEQIKAVIIAINSPGGSTAGGEELYEAISLLREQKPVVAVIHELGASAAYMSAIAADRIFARRLSIVGSIGVLFQHVNASKLLQTIGIDFDKVATGPLKAEPDIDEPLEGEVRASMQALVNDSYQWFVDIVSERRSLDRAKVLTLADGRILTGRMALEVNLIDAIGSEVEAIAWLEKEKDIEAGLKIITHYPLPENEFEQLVRYIGTGLGAFVGLDRKFPNTLDGLVSLWQSDIYN